MEILSLLSEAPSWAQRGSSSACSNRKKAPDHGVPHRQCGNMSGKKVLYDDDDFYDEHDAEEDYYGDYGDFDPGESQLVGKQSNKTPVKVAQPFESSNTSAALCFTSTSSAGSQQERD